MLRLNFEVHGILRIRLTHYPNLGSVAPAALNLLNTGLGHFRGESTAWPFQSPTCSGKPLWNQCVAANFDGTFAPNSRNRRPFSQGDPIQFCRSTKSAALPRK